MTTTPFRDDTEDTSLPECEWCGKPITGKPLHSSSDLEPLFCSGECVEEWEREEGYYDE